MTAPSPGAGDYFGYPSAVSGEWIAAAANEDDAQGTDAGAVHLYRRQAGVFVHRQTVYSPTPAAGDLFGERLLLDGSWLFVSAFREREHTGAVHVYRLVNEQWVYHQTLQAAFAEAGSAFGVGLTLADDVLAVSAPGFLFSSPDIDDDRYPPRGITLFHLEEGFWRWQREATETPSTSFRTWGFALAQLSPTTTVAATPDEGVNASYYGPVSALAGRLYLHRWPERLGDPFMATLADLPALDGEPAKAGDDHNRNGLPNLVEWMLGYDPGLAPTGYAAQFPWIMQPFLRPSQVAGERRGLHFMVPRIRRGLNRPLVVETSSDLRVWRVAEGARWEVLEGVTRHVGYGLVGSASSGDFHPVFIPDDDFTSETVRFVRLRVQGEE